ncbi:hypothetical protein [Verrucomicrobium spinosum]|uniref:hypothetical protein n=1 Tax=Verrucomicrobium spinosum TaxID=2736 RepID=UPI00094642CF|nr:hypothetical protein [Verrucomicrobium spinosum]
MTDSNGDGLLDGLSWSSGINPASLDSDGDGVSNLDELAKGTSPLSADSDGDGVADNLDASRSILHPARCPRCQGT